MGVQYNSISNDSVLQLVLLAMAILCCLIVIIIIIIIVIISLEDIIKDLNS